MSPRRSTVYVRPVDDPLARCDRLLGKPTLALSEAQAIRHDELDIWLLRISSGSSQFLAEEHHVKNREGSERIRKQGWAWLAKMGSLCGFQHMANFGAAMTISGHGYQQQNQQTTWSSWSIRRNCPGLSTFGLDIAVLQDWFEWLQMAWFHRRRCTSTGDVPLLEPMCSPLKYITLLQSCVKNIEKPCWSKMMSFKLFVFGVHQNSGHVVFSLCFWI